MSGRPHRRLTVRQPLAARRTWMPRYLISFDDGSMTFPDEDLPQVSRDAHRVVAEAKAAGVWIFGGGIDGPEVNVVDTDGSIRPNPYPADKPFVGGFSIIEVP